MHRLAATLREASNARGRLSFQGLRIQPAFAGDNHISSAHRIFQTDGFGHDLESQPDCSRHEAEQAEPQAAGGTRAGDIPLIVAASPRDHVRQLR